MTSNSEMRLSVRSIMDAYAEAHPFNFTAHMIAATATFYLKDRPGLDVIMRLQFLAAGHKAVAYASRLDPEDSTLIIAHQLTHSLMDGVIQEMRERGMIVEEYPQSREASSTDTKTDSELTKYEEDFERWAKELGGS